MLPVLALLLAALDPALADPPTTLDARLAEAEQLREQRLLRERWRPSEATYAAALRGEQVTGIEGDDGPRRVWVVTVLDVPLPRFWAAINDDRSKVKFTRLDFLALVEGQYCGAQRKTFQYAGGGVLTDRWYVLDQRMNTSLSAASEGRVRELMWRSVADVDALLAPEVKRWAEQGLQVPFTEGAWYLVDLGDGRTLVEYSSRTDPGGWVSNGLGAAAGQATLGENLENLRRLAVAGPSCPII